MPAFSTFSGAADIINSARVLVETGNDHDQTAMLLILLCMDAIGGIIRPHPSSSKRFRAGVLYVLNGRLEHLPAVAEALWSVRCQLVHDGTTAYVNPKKGDGRWELVMHRGGTIYAERGLAMVDVTLLVKAAESAMAGLKAA